MDDPIVWVNRCMIIPATWALLARTFAGKFGVGGTGMWTVPLVAVNGDQTVITHYISTGMIDKRIADVLGSPQALHDLAQTAFGFDMPLEVCTQLLSSGDITDISGELTTQDALNRLGLQRIDQDNLVLDDASGDTLQELLGKFITDYKEKS